MLSTPHSSRVNYIKILLWHFFHILYLMDFLIELWGEGESWLRVVIPLDGELENSSLTLESVPHI